MRILFALAGCLLACVPAAQAVEQGQSATTSHGLTLYGKLKYGPYFTHYDYTNPNAPKDGRLVLQALGATFDSLNPYIVKGNAADGLGLIFDSLMAQNVGEPNSEYGLVAQSVTVPADKSWVEYTLRPNAHWSDGTPITPEDVIFSFDILKSKGMPMYRHYYANVAKAEKTGPHKVRFTFSESGNNELPFIVGQLAVLPSKYWATHNFEETEITPPLSSGPYKISSLEIGRTISYQRDPNYWGKDLPVNKGRYNFDTIRYDYYRDDSVTLEAFKAGKIDFRWENSSKQWATGYDVPAVKDGRIIRQILHFDNPQVYQGFIYNIRRKIFQNPKVREALGYAFDFEWTNKNIFYSQYVRTRSYFGGGELSAKGLPSPAELKLLEPFKSQLDPRLFTEEYDPPDTGGTQEGLRKNLRVAARLLSEAGWVQRNGKLVNKDTGQPFQFEVLIIDPAQERVLAPFVDNLKLLGVDASLRMVDQTQYVQRVQTHDFDMVVLQLPQSLSPGNEQRDYWGSEAADREGSRNYIGIKSPVVDQLIKDIIFAKDREAQVTAIHALDRVLQWGFYSIPELHTKGERIAYWDKFGRPDDYPHYASLADQMSLLDSWWIDPVKMKALQAKGGERQ